MFISPAILFFLEYQNFFLFLFFFSESFDTFPISSYADAREQFVNKLSLDVRANLIIFYA
jgi:hypothetical protein